MRCYFMPAICNLATYLCKECHFESIKLISIIEISYQLHTFVNMVYSCVCVCVCVCCIFDL